MDDGVVMCFHKQLCSRSLELAWSSVKRQDGVWILVQWIPWNLQPTPFMKTD